MGARLSAERVRRFFERHLLLDTGGREHITVLFYDAPLPEPFLEGLGGVKGTRLEMIDAGQIRNQADVLRELHDPSRRYVSVLDYCTRAVFPPERSAAGFARIGRGIDYTSFEFPRFDLDEEQIVLLLDRFTAGDPGRERAQADAFYRLLGDNPDYSIEVRSGPALDRVFTVRGPSPWMEICGPLAEGDIRFAPGSEVFYNGPDVKGTLHCAGAINLLPLRSDHLEENTCRALLDLGQRIPDDPLDLTFRAGRLAGITSRGPLAQEFMAVFDRDEAFSWVVEVGVGMAASAGPLIHAWAAPTNEAVPGIHVGLGADPGNPLRFDTKVHMDFVAPDVQIAVNGTCFFDRGTFAV
jgi:hypothetical protein